MSNQMGKRYECETCGGQVICVKAGDGSGQCCGTDLATVQPKELPSAD